MKWYGQFFVGCWVVWTIYVLAVVGSNPEYSIKWGIGFLILGIYLWYKGDKKERDKADEDWLKEQQRIEDEKANNKI